VRGVSTLNNQKSAFRGRSSREAHISARPSTVIDIDLRLANLR
jgi:hypothetical protein